MRIPCATVLVALTAAVAVPVTVTASPAEALSCVGPSTVIADALQVYSGTIVDARDNHILVDVAEVWKGGPVEEEVWLAVEMVEWTSWVDGMNSEISDGYTSGETWVFAPDGQGTVGPCSAWAMGDGMRKYLTPFRPEQPKAPVAEGVLSDAGEAVPDDTKQSSLGLIVGGGAFGVALLVVLLVALARRRVDP